jgi:aldehyde:ferredoxin oxidoreductase
MPAGFYGWAGTILYVDLTRGKIHKEPLSMATGAKYLGGRGINAKLLWDLIRKPGIDPLSPENVLIFGTGTLTGTIAPTNGRTFVTCKGAITNLYLKTSMGGHWGAELKSAGYDHIVIQGASKKPSYIWIDDDNVEIRDASQFWGMDVRETDKALKEELGDKDIRVACIGPAGENLVKFASIINSVYHSASRGGAGTVMGSKKLKAIAVRGSGTIEIKNPEKFYEAALAANRALTSDPSVVYLRQYGTSGFMETANELYINPAYNWKIIYINPRLAKSVSGISLVEKGYLRRRAGCFGCPIGCFRFTVIESGPFAGTHTGGPQWESVSDLGPRLGIFDVEVLLKSMELCNIMGMDTTSLSHAISWAMECYERGVLTKQDTDEIDLRFGNAEAVLKLIPMIARRDGRIGNLLADGVKEASKKVGKDSWKWALCNSKGLGITAVDIRTAKGYALAFAVNPRGEDHLMTETIAELGLSPDAIALIEKITGDKKYATSRTPEKRAEIVRWHEDVYAVTDALGLCAFTTTLSYVITPKIMAELFSTATGIEANEKEILRAGRRIVTLEKCFNTREGADRKLDDLPWRIMHEPLREGPVKGMVTSPEELDKMLDEYYTLHEWDLKTSWPYQETLEMLDLKDVASDLGKVVKLPVKKKGN